MKFQLYLTNTLTGVKSEFEPLKSSNVQVYVCGITPYDYAHIGHARCYVTFDLLFRLLQALGYGVTYVRNFTDIDDKLISRAARELGNPFAYRTVAEKFITAFTEDMAQLHCLVPTHEPRVTQTIPAIIEMIQLLITQGHAYVAGGDVYYDVKTFNRYGLLSKRNLLQQIAGARVDVDDRKRSPYDFALWKGEKEGSYWESPWGWGRPGWHIECSAMAKKHLGITIDIHGGGMDLIFPHHENEIAQSEGASKATFARYWMHNAFVRIDKEKMSKSLGNFFTIRQVLNHFDAMILRYYLLNHHYTIPLDFSWQDVEAHKKAYERIVKLFESVAVGDETLTTALQNPIAARMMRLLCDDLNGAGAFGVLFEKYKEIEQDAATARAVKILLQQLFGLSLAPIEQKAIQMTPEIESLMQARTAARSRRDWATADRIRDQLMSLGVEVQDSKL
ncbi:cysteine--tRNA ligase [Candidatus Dependentiae bacterium]|nr:cysteine--tRNA ligase [Candidatus Dependentiae bacterium]